MPTLLVLAAAIVCVSAGATVVAPIVDRRWPSVPRSVVIIGSALVVPAILVLMLIASFLYTIIHPACPRYAVCGANGLIELGLIVASIATLLAILTFATASFYMRLRIDTGDDDVQNPDSHSLS